MEAIIVISSILLFWYYIAVITILIRGGHTTKKEFLFDLIPFVSIFRVIFNAYKNLK